MPKTKRPAHRPPVLPEGCRRVTVNLTPAEYETARRLGQGNLSAGVRRALTSADTASCQQPPETHAN